MVGEVFLWGYRYDERRDKLPALSKFKAGVTIRERKVELSRRPLVGVSLGMHVVGSTLPKCDPLDPATMHAGVLKRFAAATPTIDAATLIKFRLFVSNWLKANLIPLAPDTDVTVEEWLRQTNYPAHRKKELLEKWKAVDDIRHNPSGKNFTCKSFMKDESYPSYKHARGINSRSDEFKCAVGPIFKAIEKIVFDHPSFIKHVPIEQRPQYIYDMIAREGASYIATDYTSFEGLFVAELMESCEFQMYEHMTQFLPDHDAFMQLVDDVLGGENLCEYKSLTVKIKATRMSGEMCTSLGNGFSNLMFMLFMCEMKGCTNVSGVVEGDDGLFTMQGTPPTADDFLKLGLIIKLEVHTSLYTASFCGIVFDEDDKQNLTDPREVLATFGWGSKEYARSGFAVKLALLRCKALSFAHQYPGCPIIGNLAFAALRMTDKATLTAKYGRQLRVQYGKRFRKVLDHMNMWEREQLMSSMRDYKKLKYVAPGMGSRHLVEQLYGIPIDHQIKIEEYLDSLTEVGPLDCPYIDMHMLSDWKHYYENYAFVGQRSDPELETPSRNWPHMAAPPEWNR